MGIVTFEMESGLFPVSECDNPEASQFLDYWNGARGDQFAPAWSDIDLMALPLDLVPRVFIVDVITDPLEFVYRFFGTWHVRMIGTEMTGKRLSDIEDNTFRSVLLDQYKSIIELRKPCLFRAKFPAYPAKIYSTEIIRAPLSHTGESIDGLMSLEILVGEEKNY